MSKRRENIIDGVLTFPIQIMEILNPKQDECIKILIEGFWNNLWHNYLKEKHCNTIKWFNEFNNKQLFNSMLTHLSKAGWITSNVDQSYAYIILNESKLLKWVTKEELIDIKFRYKFLKYRLQRTKSTLFDVVQINNRYEQTGLIRKGFMKAGNNTFKYDTKYLTKYIEQIAQNVMKGLSGSTKDITYQEIIQELLLYYSVDNTEYTLGNCIIDSRGRAIHQCAKKVFNPISCKDARALLIHPKPKPLTTDGYKIVCAGISELLGYRGKDYEDKIKYGESAYIRRELPSLEDMELFNNYDDLHIRIWLERIYENMDNLESNSNWYIPITLDATASMIQLIGVLTNDHAYMKGTNLIKTEDGFQDIWSVDYCSRTHIKKALTPKLYGSSKHPKELWDKNKLDYTQQQLNKINEDVTTGIYANANKFKDFIINNVQSKDKMKVNINDEEFWIECNRFKWEETVQLHYFIYTSQQGIMKRITKEVNLVPDLNQFKRFFVTLLLHNLDSQIANSISMSMNWVLPVHDSFTIHPNDGREVRHMYINWMDYIHKRRHYILNNYFKSIGINESFTDVNEKSVSFTFSPFCLK